MCVWVTAIFLDGTEAAVYISSESATCNCESGIFVSSKSETCNCEVATAGVLEAGDLAETSVVVKTDGLPAIAGFLGVGVLA